MTIQEQMFDMIRNRYARAEELSRKAIECRDSNKLISARMYQNCAAIEAKAARQLMGLE